MTKVNSLIMSIFVATVAFFPLSLQAAPPIILDGGYKIVETGFEVSWITNQSATSQLEWGTSPALGNLTPKDNDLERYHIVTVNVSSAGTYYYQAISENSAGEEVRSAVYEADLSSFVLDTEAPVIIINGAGSISIDQGETYADPGVFMAMDQVDGDLLSQVVTVNPVNTSVPGTYTVTYSVSDSAGNAAQATRTVTVNAVASDTIPPVIIMNGPDTISIDQGETYTDLGVMLAQDDVDGDLLSQVVTTNPVNTSVPGTYTVTYSVSDSAGNAAQVARTVTVNAVAGDTTPPVIIMNGSDTISIDQGETYTDLGVFMAMDDVDGDLLSQVVTVNPVNTSVPGTYTVTYSVSDSASNASQVTRTVNVIEAFVVDEQAPVLVMQGQNPVTLPQGTVYIDAGAMAQDDLDGDLTSSIVIENSVNHEVAGFYNVIYSVSDSAGNTSEAIRTVEVVANSQTEVTASVQTREIGGFVGDKRYIQLRSYNIENSNVEIELPYYDGQESRQKFSPSEIKRNRIYFNLPEATYTGQGSVYVNSQKVGDFSYVVRLNIPKMERMEFEQKDVVTITGTGFNPAPGANKIVLYKVQENGRMAKQAYEVDSFSTDLKSASFQVPVGVTSGSMFVEARYVNSRDREVVNRGRAIRYSVKPTLASVEWSDENNLGDKITIQGNGIAFRPQIIFVDAEGNIFDRKQAILISIDENTEVIEVLTSKRKSSYKVLLRSGREQLELESAEELEANPLLISVQGTGRYFDRVNRVSHFGARVGDTVRIKGAGFRALTDDIQVVFQGTNGEIVVSPSEEQVNRAGNLIRVSVPEGAVSGEVYVRVEGRSSATQILEIIPEFVSMASASIEPGQNLYVQVQGSGTELDQASIQFFYGRKLLSEVQPSTIVTSGNNIRMNFQVPESASERKLSMLVKYGNFSSKRVSVTVRPHITSAVLSEDNQFLHIKGYGFSRSARENKLVFKTLDGSSIEHKNRIVGIKTDGNETELRVRMSTLDTSYDYVAVQVGDDISNDDRL